MDQLYLIKEAAKRAGLAPETVRSYCRQGQLRPLRDSSGRRRFTDEDVRKIRAIFISNLRHRPNLMKKP